MKALVIAETKQTAQELCAGARGMADEVILCMVGAEPVQGIADTCFHLAIPSNRIADDAYPAINGLFDEEKPGIVFGEDTEAVLSLIGRLAAHAGSAATVGVKSFADDTATCLYYGGTGVRTSKYDGKTRIYVAGPGLFNSDAASGTDDVKDLPFIEPVGAVEKLSEDVLPKSGVNLTAADIVIGCGGGFSEKEDLQLAYDLAAKLGGEVGCTRPLAEGLFWFPKESYIGVTGQMLSPKVYIGVGISGQMQHMVGVNSAETVIAINKDKNAPIFRQCDYGFVGDLKTALPVLTEAL